MPNGTPQRIARVLRRSVTVLDRLRGDEHEQGGAGRREALARARVARMMEEFRWRRDGSTTRTPARGRRRREEEDRGLASDRRRDLGARG